MRKFLLFIFFVSLGYASWGQRGCVTDEVTQLNKSEEQILLQQQVFEEWLLKKKGWLVDHNALQALSETTIYKIPVVVHIIHNGEAYGSGFNITDEQVNSQIDVLNRDFRHLNADSINTPEIFKPFMADIGFEFVLAKRDPNGLPTNGITRTNGNKTAWNFRSELDSLMSLIYWSSNDYLNIWVAPASGIYLGFASYPSSDIIEGTEDAENNPLTDGVVIRTSAFGSSEIYPSGDYKTYFDLGRTATHEIGHFFGLHHIWGTSPSCSVDDFVADTPRTNYFYLKCPPDGSTTYSCNAEPSMFMNYMDYVYDDCMNLFTLGQKDRMVIVVNNSPRRASLLTSKALIIPTVLDATISAIPSPGTGTCVNELKPAITIYNSGTILITEVELAMLIGEIEISRQRFLVSINPDQDTTLLLPQFFLTEYGKIKFTASIITVNGLPDAEAYNNTQNKQVFFSDVTSTINENFDSWPDSWAIRSTNPISNWNFVQAPQERLENNVATLSYYQQYPGSEDQLVLPLLDLSSYNNPYLLFDHAYGKIAEHKDALAVLVSLDCGNSFQDTLFLKSGKELATTEMPVKFTPSGPIDWQTSVIDLSGYKSQRIQLAFTGKSDGGNNIYLDNILVVDDDYEDIAIKGLLNESATYSASISSIGLILENKGTSLVNNLVIEVKEYEKVISSQVMKNLKIRPGEQTTVSLDNTFSPGYHSLKFSILLDDASQANNALLANIHFLTDKEAIPYREKFNSGSWNEVGNWTTSSPNSDDEWQIWPLSNDFLFYPAFSQGYTGSHHWLVLPKFDFSNTNIAALQYKVAYASNELNNEVLRIWVSINNGESFELIETKTGTQMATYTSASDWYPVIAADWADKFINLSDFAGEEDVFIAFEAVDGDGSNIYIDDMELFIANEPNLIEIADNEMAVYPNPVSDNSARISFNLTKKQDVNIRIIDATGSTISNQRFTNVLNQTYPLELSTRRNGIYIIQAVGADFNDVLRILVSH